jgi:mannose-6-phosphate isomerase-like protein (cupin superfamily)
MVLFTLYFSNNLLLILRTVMSNEDTGGAYSLGELEVIPGGGNHMHTHSAFAETFTAIKGVLGVNVRNERFYLWPGESLTVPLHTPHHFFNDGNETVSCL